MPLIVVVLEVPVSGDPISLVDIAPVSCDPVSDEGASATREESELSSVSALVDCLF